MSTPRINLDGDEEAKSDLDQFVAEQAADFGCTPEEIIQLIHEAFLRETCGQGGRKTQHEVFDYVDKVRNAIYIIESCYQCPTQVRPRCFDALNALTELSDYIQTKMHPGT